jgi:hypothetical protein
VHGHPSGAFSDKHAAHGRLGFSISVDFPDSAAPAAAAAAAGAPQSGSSVNKHNNKNNYKISKTQRFPYPMSIPAITVVP